MADQPQPAPPPSDAPSTSARKRDHLRIVLADQHAAGVDPGWSDVRVVPRALPVGSPADVELGTELLGHHLRAPLVLAGMTGGFAGAERLNAALGQAAEELGLAVGVGSQRAALADPSLAGTFAAVRRNAPTALVMANIGAAQLVDQAGAPALGVDDLQRAVEMVDADVLAIHLNLVQELVQAEGDRCFDGVLGAVERAVAALDVPVLAKETGAGLDRESARQLVEVGVAALDVGGAGGTSFARVERERGGERSSRLGEMLDSWGIPTAAAVLEARGLGVPVIATGGVRSGLDAARALALGASAVGLGRPAAEAAVQGVGPLVARLHDLCDELRTAMVLAGAMRPAELADPVLSGATLEWARQRSLLERGSSLP